MYFKFIKFEIIFYRKFDSKCPFDKFYQTCSNKERVELAAHLEALSRLGYQAKRPLVDYLGDGIYELRVKVERKQLRALYFFFAGNKIVITHGFVKKSKKVPKIEIEKARRFRQDFILKKENENG